MLFSIKILSFTMLYLRASCESSWTLFNVVWILDIFIDCSSNEGSKKHSIKFFLHSSGSIAARFSYDQVCLPFFVLVICYTCEVETDNAVGHKALVNVVKKIPKATWNAKERFDLLSICFLLFLLSWVLPSCMI